MGRPKGKKDTKPRKTKNGTSKTVQFAKQKPTKKPEVETKTHTESEEFIPDAQPEAIENNFNQEAEDEAARSEVDMLLTAAFSGLATFTKNPEDALTANERETSSGMCAAFYARVMRPQIKNVDSIAAAICIGSLLASRVPSIMKRIGELKSKRPVNANYAPVYPSPEPRHDEVTQ